ncbi:DUF5340 family protein [Romeria aff. gracilis LEGE 07310]|uniref:DUF5340 family protein n=1 Tax=Vasconcelosia minhoensis LEGE 07310 TaxID=915328 RepID=A0A8J7DR93_9CYAN|nr:DUF5340 family protein [Romeria gracilis]MBE9078049.1 DUF5340 family protein [Romeria aff. gracilis LEGE 07310]
MTSPVPLPSHVHYELLLQLLERRTLPAVPQYSQQQQQVQSLIVSLRKALSQQKRLEETCRHEQTPVEYYWSLNEIPPPLRSDI